MAGGADEEDGDAILDASAVTVHRPLRFERHQVGQVHAGQRGGADRQEAAPRQAMAERDFFRCRY